MVLPVQRVTFRRALIGAAAATTLWEIARHVLVWYFHKLSLVNVVYGSLVGGGIQTIEATPDRNVIPDGVSAPARLDITAVCPLLTAAACKNS
jgi:hypothetical protein